VDYLMKSTNDNEQEPKSTVGLTKGSLKLGHGDYLRFRDLVLERSGLHFPEKKRVDLEIGLDKAWQTIPAPAVKQMRLLDLETYYRFLKEGVTALARAEMERLINLLTIGETHFFRDSAQFEALATRILPQLIACKRAAAAATGMNPPGIPQLRLWSAGCATGEEAYSLAILLHELIPDLKDWRILILATDINQDSLSRAQQATYSNWSFRETRAKTSRALYFTPQGKFYHLHDHIRQMVTFAPLNLIEDNFPALANDTTSMDLIICRNVTIYFTGETTNRLIHKFYEALVEGGWLVVGPAELSLATYRAFQARPFPHTVLYQKSGPPVSWPVAWEGLDLAKSNLTNAVPIIQARPNAPRPSAPVGALDSNGSLPSYNPENLKPKAPENIKTKPLPPHQAGVSEISDSGASSEPGPYHTAKLLLNEGYANQAILTLKSQLDKLPESWQAQAYCLLARAYANQGQLAQACHWAESAIARDTLLTEAYYLLALVYKQEDKLEQAISYFKKTIYLDREAPMPHFNLAMLYKKRGEVSAAIRTLNNVVKILSHWPPEKIIPDSDGTNAASLLNLSRQTLKEFEKGKS
jgi:chemotaxis protein methyltransferase CheR